METDELRSSLELAISSVQRIGRLLQEGQCVNSADLLSATESLPQTVRSLSAVGSSKAAALFPKLGSCLSSVLSAEAPAAVRLPALQCLIACLACANEVASIEKTKKRATDFAREHLDHRNASIRSSCVTWLSYFPALFRPAAEGERFCSQWRETMLSVLSSHQISLASLSDVSLPGGLSVGSPLPLPDPLDSSQTARRIDSLFHLSLSLLSHRSPVPIPIPIEAIVYTVTLATSHLHTELERGPIREVQCSAWGFLDKLSGLLPSCLLPLAQPISALFAQSMASLSPLSVSLAMLRALSSWLEASRGGVLPLHLHQFLRFLVRHSSLRTASATEPRALSGRKRHRVSTESEFCTDRDAVLLGSQCLRTSASLMKNCVTEVSALEYDTFMSHLTLLIQDSAQLCTQFPSDPLLLQYSSLLHALLSDSLLCPHSLAPSQLPALIPHFTLGLHSPHAAIRQSCRAAVSLVETLTHPTLPPIRPVSCYSLPPCPLEVPLERGDITPPPRVDTPPVTDSTAGTTDVPAVNSPLLTADRDSDIEYQPLVISPICSADSPAGVSDGDSLIETAQCEERPAKLARVDSTELPVAPVAPVMPVAPVAGNELLSTILSTFVEEGPDV